MSRYSELVSESHKYGVYIKILKQVQDDKKDYSEGSVI